MPEDSNWKTPVESPRASISYVFRSSSGSEPIVDAADELDRLVDDVEVPQAEEVHLQEPEVDDVPHPELRDDLRVGALLLEGHDLDQRLGADDDACGVDRVGAGQALERTCEVDDLLRDRVRVDRLAQLCAGL